MSRRLTSLELLVLLLCMSSCATNLTEDEQYEKDNRETLRREHFYQTVADCKAVHGHMVIEGTGSKPATMDGKIVPPGAGQEYYCKRR